MTQISVILLTVFFVFVPTTLAAIQCWVGQETVSNGRRLPTEIGGPYQSVQCNDADYCFNSYVKRHKQGDDSYTITKSCGETGKCFEDGCRGPGDEKNCCCSDNLCNSSNGLIYPTAGILIILSLVFRP
uniref:Activin_recp domain-containing protein n=1 Tax=Caenorhabditis tropicalis TaxID=1561998 RepID=A0A1I7SZJ4_9PELO